MKSSFQSARKERKRLATDMESWEVVLKSEEIDNITSDITFFQRVGIDQPSV